MAIKPQIYKFGVSISDMNRHYYGQENLTLALHPSETIERMMVRLLAYCLNASDSLKFSKGLSTDDEPDLWAHSDDGVLQSWIEVGEPGVDRLKKRSRLAPETIVYCFNHKADTWWRLAEKELSALNVTYYQFEWPEIVRLAELVSRGMQLSVTISDNNIFIASDQGECEVNVMSLQH